MTRKGVGEGTPVANRLGEHTDRSPFSQRVSRFNPLQLRDRARKKEEDSGGQELVEYILLHPAPRRPKLPTVKVASLWLRSSKDILWYVPDERT